MPTRKSPKHELKWKRLRQECAPTNASKYRISKPLHVTVISKMFRFLPVTSGPLAFTLATTCSMEGRSGPLFGNVTRNWHKPKKIWLESVTKSKYEYKLPITS